jgi:flavin-dependent dehydrogenase
VTLAGAPGTADSPVTYCPRRTILDKLLVDAAAEAGAEIREGFTVEQVLMDGDSGHVAGIKGRSKTGGSVTERASVVVGADGRHSIVARQSSPKSTTTGRRCRPPTTSTGAACRCAGASRSTSAPTGDARRWRRTTA